MIRKYYILVIMLCCLLCGQTSYGQSTYCYDCNSTGQNILHFVGTPFRFIGGLFSSLGNPGYNSNYGSSSGSGSSGWGSGSSGWGSEGTEDNWDEWIWGDFGGFDEEIQFGEDESFYYGEEELNDYLNDYCIIYPSDCTNNAISWYLDIDGDSWHSETKNATISPGIGWVQGTSNGLDCDDTLPDGIYAQADCTKTTWVIDIDDDKYYVAGSELLKYINWIPTTGYKKKENCISGDCDDSPTGGNVHQLNKCKKCEVEPESTDWKISDVIDNATGLLKEMIDKAKLTAPNLKIIKSGNHQGAKTKVKCAEINIGENAAEIKSNAVLAFELSHIINTNLYNTTNRDGLLKTKDDFVKGVALFEAEGFVFSQIIKNTEAKTLNDCEKNLLAISTLKQDYSNLTVDQIKNQIRQNGELDSQAQDLIKYGKVVSSNKEITFVQKYEAEYNRWQPLINYYRTEEKLSETKIARILRNEKPDCN